MFVPNFVVKRTCHGVSPVRCGPASTSVQPIILCRCKQAAVCTVLNVTCQAVGMSACMHLFVKNLTQLWNCQISGARIQVLAAVAQLDRVLGYEPRGRGFESCQPHHMNQGFNVERH